MLTSEQRDELKTLILEYGIAAVMESSESRPRQINRIIDFVSGVAAASDARAEGPETVDERAAFEREHDRYFVIKRKDLDIDQLRDLTAFIDHGDIPTRQCVVVEEDWPEYEPVWAMIEARMTGRAALATAPTMSEAARARRFRHVKTGCQYRIICEAGMESDCTHVVVYQSEDAPHGIWVRPHAEFFDGRFAEIDRAAAKGGSDV